MDDCPLCQEEGSLLGNRLVEEFGVDEENDLPVIGQGRACVGMYVLGRLHEQEHPSRLMETPSQESIGDCPACDEELTALVDSLQANYDEPQEDGTLVPETYRMSVAAMYFLGRLHEQGHNRTLKEWSKQAAERLPGRNDAGLRQTPLGRGEPTTDENRTA